MASQYGGDIRYGIKFDIDKAGLNGIKTSLQEVQNVANNLLKGINPTGLNLAEKEVRDIISTVGQLETAFSQAFNPQLGTVNIQKFNSALGGLNLNQVQTQMAKLGATGTNAFRNMTTQLITTNMQIKQSSSLLTKMGETFMNTMRWSIASSAINSVSSSIRKAYNYTKELDESLNNIMLVTDKSADSMEKFARQANKAAKNLGATTTEYTNASLIYYQQGLSDAETAARTEVTLKAANVTKQSADAVSEQLTAVWNGYKVSAQETELYIDKLAKVAASTASDLEELSVGMSRVASAANLMGVDIDQLNAQLATIISVTREAPETIGTSLKTIFARMSDIEAGLDEETSLGEYTQGMADLGFNVLDANDKLRDMGDVIEEIGGKWTSLSREQQVSLAQTMAGTRQYSRLLSLFDNWSMYEKSLNDSASAAGFLQEQQDEYMESMEAHLNQLKVASEGLYNSLFNSDSLNTFIDGLTNLVTLLDNFVQGIGGGGTALMGLLTLLVTALNTKIATGLARIGYNAEVEAQNTLQRVESEKLLQTLLNNEDATVREIAKYKLELIRLNKVLTQEEQQALNTMLQQITAEQNLITEAEESKKIFAERAKLQTGISYSGENSEAIKQRVKAIQKESSDTLGAKGLGLQSSVAKIDTSDIAQQTESATQELIGLRRKIIGAQTRLDNNVTKANQAFDEFTQKYSYTGKDGQTLGYADLKKNNDGSVSRATSAGKDFYVQLEKTDYSKFSAAAAQAENDLIALSQKFDEVTLKKEALDNELKNTQSITEIGISFENWRAKFEGVIQSSPEVQAAVKQVEQAIGEYSSIVSKSGASSENARIAQEALGAAFKQLDIEVSNALGHTAKEADKNYNSMIQSAKLAKTQITQSMEATMATLQKRFNMDSLVSAASNVMRLTFGVQSLMGAINALNNEDLSFFEKLLQITMGLSMGLTQIVPAIKLVYSSIGQTGQMIGLENQFLKQNISLKGIKSIQDARTAIETQLIAFQEQKVIDAMTKKGIVLTEENRQYAHGVAVKQVHNIMIKQGIINQEGETIATEKNTIAEWKNVAAKAAKYWYIAVIVALVAGSIAVFNQASKAYNQQALEAERAGEAAKRAAEAFSEASSEYDNFKNNLSAYQDASSAMDDLTEGTIEYKEKLLEANEAAMKLISSLNLMAGQDYTINSEGKIVFDESSYEEMQVRQLEKYQLASNNLTRAQNQAQLESHDADITDYARESNYTLNSDEFLGASIGMGLGGAAAGAAIGAAIGSAAPGIGTAIGAAAGLLVGGVASWVAAERQEQLESDFQNAVFDLSEKLDEVQLSSLNAENIEGILGDDYDADIVDALTENVEATKELIQATQAQIEATKQAAAQEARYNLWQTNSQDYRSLDDRDKQLLANIVADRAAATLANEDSKDYQKVYDEVDAMWNDGKDDEIIYKEYLQALYGDEAENYRITDDYGTHSTIQKKVEGSWENVGDEDAISNEEMNEVITRARILGEALEEDKEKLSQLVAFGDSLEEGGVTSDYVDEILNDLSLGNEVDLSALTAEQIKNLDYSNLDTEAQKAIAEAKNNWSETAHLQRQEEEFQAALKKTAESFEIDKDTLEQYTQSILDNNKSLEGNKEAALECAKQQIIFARGVENLQKALDDNLEILEDWNENAFETHEAAAAVSSALEEMFGVRVSSDFVHQYLNDIKDAAEGDIEAIEKLSALAAKDYVTHMAISQEDQAAINNIIDELSNQDVTIGAKVKVDNQESIDAINEMLRAGEMTEEELNSIFSAINFKPNVKMVPSGEETTSENTITTVRTDDKGDISSWTDVITTKSKVMVPQITADGTGSGNSISGNSFTTTNTSSSLSNSLGSLKDWDADASKDNNKIEDERDIFHDINVEIEKLTRNYDRLTKAREKMVGGDVVDALNEELDLINQQNQAQRAKLEIAQQDATRRRSDLADYGVQFNTDGTIANYNDILNKYQAAANASGKDEDKEAYENLKSDLEAYEDLLLSEIPNIQDEITELMDAWVEANIEKFTLDINLGIELKDIKKEWRELQSEVFGGEDNPLSQFNNALQGFTDIFDGDGDNLFEDTMDRMNMFIEEYQKIKDGGVSDMFGTDAAAALEQIEDMRSQLFDMTSELLEYIEIIEESMDTLTEEIAQTQDDIMSTYDMALAIIEHQKNVGNILYGDNFDTSELDEEEFQERLDKIAKEREEYVRTAEEANKLKDALPDENDPEYNEKFRDYVEKAVDANEILSDLMSDVEETLELLNTILDNQMNKALDLFERTMTADAFEGWSTISDRWEKDQQLAEVYLSTVNQEYEIQKLMNKISDDLLDKQYDSLYAQQAINKFKETELAMLMEKDKLTEAEVKRANQLYELTLLQIALEEARNNKSSMKLKRDSQGNYTYQYVADNEAIAKAEQNILDKQNEIYNESVENAIDNIERFNDAGANMQDQLQSLYESDNYQEYLGMLVNGETDSERFKELQGWLDENLGYIASDADYLMSSAQQSAINNISNILKDAGFTDINLNKLTDEQRKVLLSEGIDLQKLTALLNYNTQSVDDNLSILYDAINSSVDAYVENTRLVMDTAKTGEDTEVDYYDNLDLIKLNTDDLRLDLEEQKEKLKKELDEMSQKYETEIKPLQNTLKEFFKDGGKFKNLMDNYTEDLNTNLIEIKNAIGTGVTTLSSALGNYASAVTTAASQSNSGGTGGSSETGGSSNTEKTTEPTKDEKLADLSKGFKVNDRISYNGKDTYNIEQVDKVAGQVLINDYLNKSDKSQWVDVSKIKDTKYDWIDLRNSKIGKNRFYNENATVFKPIAKSTSGKFVVEVSSKGATSTYNIGDRIWIDPHSKGSGSWDWDVLKPGQEYSWWMMDFDSTFKDVDGGMSTWLKAKGFNTGGYTGQWPKGSKEGRWALLHQKELILNEQDTPKILDAVKLVREMTTGSIISDMQNRMNNLISNLENDLIGTYVKLEAAAGSVYSDGQALEQQVHIDATFPNVKDAKEIEAALNNLVNVASQYATEDK